NYIVRQKRLAAEAKSLETVMGMTPAVEILKKVSDAVPNAQQVPLKVRTLHIEDDRVRLVGSVRQAAQIRLVETALRGVARGGQIQSQTGAALPDQGGVSFTMTFQVDRNLVVAK